MKVFVPFSEDLVARHGLSLGDLVPFDLQYECLRLQEIDAKLDRAPHLPGDRPEPGCVEAAERDALATA